MYRFIYIDIDRYIHIYLSIYLSIYRDHHLDRSPATEYRSASRGGGAETDNTYVNIYPYMYIYIYI